jgi:hypothetical protein
MPPRTGPVRLPGPLGLERRRRPCHRGIEPLQLAVQALHRLAIGKGHWIGFAQRVDRGMQLEHGICEHNFPR